MSKPKDPQVRAFRSLVSLTTGVGYTNIPIMPSEDAFAQGMKPFLKHTSPKGTVYIFSKPHPNAHKGK